MIFLNKILLLLFGAIFFHLVVVVLCQDDAESDDYAKYKLIFAQAIVRHGDRNIKRTYPNDPWKNKTYWVNGYGELSNIGKREQYDLGKSLRKRYKDLIGNTFSNQRIYIRSSDETRNLMSAQSNAAGLFPPEDKDEQWNEQLGKKWQPVPAHSVPDKDDYLLNSRAYCPAFKPLLDDCVNSPKIQGIMEKYKDLIEFIQTNSGKTVRNVHDISKMYDILFVEDRRGYELPEWGKKALSNSSLNYLGAVGYQSLTCTTELKKMKAGFLIKEILDRFKQKTEKTLKPKKRTMAFYFTQATVLVSVLNALEMFDDEIPPFASTILFELYRQRSKYYVQIVYKKNTTSENDVPLKIPHCGKKCELDKLYELYADILPTESETYELVCRVKEEGGIGGYNLYIILGSVFTGVALVTLIIFVSVRMCGRRRDDQNSPNFNRA